MAQAKVNPKQVVARSMSQASLKKKQAEVKETQFMVQRMQAEAQQRRVEANKVKGSIMVAKTAVARTFRVEDEGNVRLIAGEQVRCNRCHGMPRL